jgi:hypothetical protein
MQRQNLCHTVLHFPKVAARFMRNPEPILAG